jgi:hypothetical protein
MKKFKILASVFIAMGICFGAATTSFAMDYDQERFQKMYLEEMNLSEYDTFEELIESGYFEDDDRYSEGASNDDIADMIFIKEKLENEDSNCSVFVLNGTMDDADEIKNDSDYIVTGTAGKVIEETPIYRLREFEVKDDFGTDFPEDGKITEIPTASSIQEGKEYVLFLEDNPYDDFDDAFRPVNSYDGVVEISDGELKYDNEIVEELFEEQFEEQTEADKDKSSINIFEEGIHTLKNLLNFINED